jgi:ribonuclease HI
MVREAAMHIDGAARGNPGPAAYAVVIEEPGQAVVEESKTIGHKTNNVAEYTALVRGLELAKELGLGKLTVSSDSELMVKQMNGEYRVKHADLIPLYEEACRLRKMFASVTLVHVRREKNKRADELCNIALDAEKPKSEKTKEKEPAAIIGGSQAHRDAIECLTEAAKAWAANGPLKPPPAMVWEQLCSILEESGLMKKLKK